MTGAAISSIEALIRPPLLSSIAIPALRTPNVVCLWHLHLMSATSPAHQSPASFLVLPTLLLFHTSVPLLNILCFGLWRSDVVAYKTSIILVFIYYCFGIILVLN